MALRMQYCVRSGAQHIIMESCHFFGTIESFIVSDMRGSRLECLLQQYSLSATAFL